MTRSLINLSNLPTRQQLLAEKCRRSFHFFFQEFWETISEEELVENWHIKYLCDELQKVTERVADRKPKLYDLIINIPPGTTKSTIVTIMLPIWAWVRDPSLRFITGSHSLDLSTEHAVRSRDILRSEKFRSYFPNIQVKTDTDNKRNYKITGKGERIVTSVGSKITGNHAHIIIVDDPQDPTIVASEVQRHTANRWMSGTLSSRKVDKAVTPVITIMQRLHEDDVSGFLLSKKKKGVKHICLPARLSESVSPSVLANNYINGLLDPNRLSEDILTESKADLGSLQFAGQFQQEPAPMDGYLIKAEWFPLFRPTAELISLPRYFDSDTAYGKEQSDNSATICYSVKDGTIYVWNVWLAKLPFNEFIPAYKDHLDLFRYTEESKIYIEPKASGTDIIQVLSSEGLNVKASESPKDNKMTRLQAALPKIETGHVKLLANQSWIEPFLAELMQFPVGKNDDQVDVLSSIVRRHLIQQSKWTYISN